MKTSHSFSTVKDGPRVRRAQRRRRRRPWWFRTCTEWPQHWDFGRSFSSARRVHVVASQRNQEKQRSSCSELQSFILFPLPIAFPSYFLLGLRQAIWLQISEALQNDRGSLMLKETVKFESSSDCASCICIYICSVTLCTKFALVWKGVGVECRLAGWSTSWW